MIPSIIMSIVCTVILFWDLLALLNLFRSSVTVQCETLLSEKEEIRNDGYLTDEFWITKITFEYEGKVKTSRIRTRSYSSPGQKLKCVYFPKQDTIIRKRDFRKLMNGTLSIILSVANLFVVLYLLFHFFDMSIILRINVTKTLSCTIATAFGVLGIVQ
ncbi:MAG: hypothetical protein K2M82_07460, partial [Lachnospiraceae bacterium]|nr:hypothetical protein [Lachnospiraceae bacterium]